MERRYFVQEARGPYGRPMFAVIDGYVGAQAGRLRDYREEAEYDAAKRNNEHNMEEV